MPQAGGQEWEAGGGSGHGRALSGHSFISQVLSACCVLGAGDPAEPPQTRSGLGELLSESEWTVS